ncbi:MAG TPA: hypothetical protein VMV23_08185, partial [Candidatus Nanopelagicaceae bacterium]|nr:hypothetical protein [Candidatus Nanopelagicaceae bacterium]
MGQNANRAVSGSDDGLATSYGYDAAGRQRQVTVANGAAMFTTKLDSQGRATQIAEGTGLYPVGFTYNADNLVTQATFPGGVTIGRQYDQANRLTQATIGDPTVGLTNTYQYAYDPTGWLNRISSTIGQVSGTPSPTVSPTPTAVPGSGSLVGSSALPQATTNLTIEGTSDWAHWGLTSAA